jgi:hypothetical protein
LFLRRPGDNLARCKKLRPMTSDVPVRSFADSVPRVIEPREGRVVREIRLGVVATTGQSSRWKYTDLTFDLIADGYVA